MGNKSTTPAAIERREEKRVAKEAKRAAKAQEKAQAKAVKERAKLDKKHARDLERKGFNPANLRQTSYIMFTEMTPMAYVCMVRRHPLPLPPCAQ